MPTAQDSELDNFIVRRFGRNALQRLNNQVRGGSNNEKGTTHEQSFAIYKLAKFYDESANDDIEITSQIRGFVDDLVVLNRTSNEKRSYQLKDCLSVSWNSEKGIAPYFHKQYIIDTEVSGLSLSQTTLVNANERVHNLRKDDIPSHIESHTNCMYFPNKTLSWLLANDTSFRQEMNKLCSFPDDDDKLLSVSHTLMGVWCSRDRNTESDTKITNLITQARKNANPDFFLPLAGEQFVLDENIIKILDSFEEISYEVSGGFLVYSYRLFSGQSKSKIGTESFQNICNVIINESPKTVRELFLLLMGTGDGA
jgi:hypothetical protein